MDLNISVETLDPSVRASNCMLEAKIGTVRQLVAKSEEELHKVHHFPKVTIREIKRKLEAHGLGLGMKLEELGMVSMLYKEMVRLWADATHEERLEFMQSVCVHGVPWELSIAA
jgi:DNA-directed RNA polymerase alpha subunit